MSTTFLLAPPAVGPNRFGLHPIRLPSEGFCPNPRRLTETRISGSHPRGCSQLGLVRPHSAREPITDAVKIHPAGRSGDGEVVGVVLVVFQRTTIVEQEGPRQHDGEALVAVQQRMVADQGFEQCGRHGGQIRVGVFAENGGPWSGDGRGQASAVLPPTPRAACGARTRTRPRAAPPAPRGARPAPPRRTRPAPRSPRAPAPPTGSAGAAPCRVPW